MEQTFKAGVSWHVSSTNNLRKSELATPLRGGGPSSNRLQMMIMVMMKIMRTSQ
jgi:hypothetical protein